MCCAVISRPRGRPVPAPSPPRCRVSTSHHGSAGQSSTTSSSVQTTRPGAQGSSSGSIPLAAPTASATILAGDGNLTSAHTPSPPCAPAPRWCDRRWVTHRSTPRAGTAMISAANGSASGVVSSVDSASTSASACSARWT